MFKLIKGLISILILGLVIVIALGTIFVYYFDANDYKAQIVSYIEERSKRSVELGNLNLSLFPSIGLSASGLKVGENPNFGDEPFIEAEEVQLGIGLLPLLRQEAQVDGIVLKGIKVNVLRNARGQFNFDDLKMLITAEQDTDSRAPTDNTSKALALTLTGFGGVALKEGYLLWDDRLNDARMVVDNLSFESAAWVANKPTSISLDGSVHNLSGTTKDLTALVALNTKVLPDLATADVEITETKMQVDLTQSGTPLSARINGKVATVKFKNGVLDHDKAIPVELDAVVHGLSEDIAALSATLGVKAEVLPDLSGSDIQVHNLSVLGNVQGLDEDLSLGATAEHNTALLAGDFVADHFALRYADMQIEGRAKFSDLYGSPTVDIALPTFNYDAWQFKQILLKGSKSGDRILLNLRQANFHQGQISAEMDVDLKSNSYQMKSLANDIPIDKIQVILADGQPMVRGQAQLNLALSGTLGNYNELLESSAGKANVRIVQGALSDKSLASIVERAVAFIEGRRRRTVGDELIFDDLSATVILDKGVAKNNDLAVQMPLLDVTGSGQVNLSHSQIDYTLYAGLKSNERIKIPIRISGNLVSPSYKPDFSQLIKYELLNKTKVKEKLKEKVTDIEKKIKDKIKDNLLEGLKDKLKLPF